MTLTPIVTFDYNGWIARYPEFAGVSQALAQEYFNEAGLYFANAGFTGSLPQAPTLLNMLTAHIAWLNAPRDANGNIVSAGSADTIPPPGRVASASEGSVSASFDMGNVNAGGPDQAWYMQSRYGAAYWAATAQFRTFHYVPAPFDPVMVGGSYPFFPRRGRIY